MFDYCTDPGTLESLAWLSCYLTTAKHMGFYWSFLTVLTLLAITAPTALLFGFGGASAARSTIAPLALVRQSLCRHRARRARYRVFPVLRHCARSGL